MNQKSTMSYFGGSIAFALFATIGGYMIAGWIGVYEVLILGLLEASLSVDNAVLNAKQLKHMSPFWRRMFVTVGMLVAVFGMRILFPIIIVAFVTGMNAFPDWSTILSGSTAGKNVLDMAIHRPDEYATALTSSHLMIAGFGGAFLLLVGLKFFLDAEKDHHWLGFIERPLALLGKSDEVRIAITLGVLYGISRMVPVAGAMTFLMSGIVGIIVYAAADLLKGLLEKEEDEDETNNVVNVSSTMKAGFAGFIYLEILDASCSFDGVIGAFAITNNLFVIAMGLGIGAMIVRSLTILLVDRDTLAEYKYLEHGAFWAILSLAGIILASAVVHIPDVVAGTLGAGFIGMSLISSIMYNRKQPTSTVAEIAPEYEEYAEYVKDYTFSVQPTKPWPRY